MKCSKTQRLINDHVDNLLDDEQVRMLKKHLENCANCRSIFNDLVSLVNNATELESLDPSDELWPAIRRQVLKKNREVNVPKINLWSFPYFSRGPKLALSTLLVILILIPVFYYTLPNLRNRINSPGENELIYFAAAEQQYQSAIEDMDRVIEARYARLNPELAAVFKKNLAIIDESIRICKKSMDKYPAKLETNKLLLICYRKKIELLNEIKDISMQS